ncbi:MAG: hypothetical protein KA054_03990 [Candidatus Moranbacteria bacterium]|nr:hypothetical protein [Candidatus Moranbacteria bacterium]
MHEYPRFNESYAENQQALLYVLGLNSPSQAPFRRIPCFMVYTKETAQTWTPNPTYILTPENEEAESDWLCLAFSVVALHHWGEWPEKDQIDCFGGFRNWKCEIGENDISFLSQFFAETWDTLREQHPSIRNLLEGGRLYLENHFDTETEDGLARLITWLRWIIKELWENQNNDCSTETDADVRALRLVVDLLGKGTLQVVIEHDLMWRVWTWILQAIHLIRNTRILPRQAHTVMTSYSPGNRLMGPAGRSTTSGHSSLGFTPFAPKFDEWGAERFQAQGLQVGFHTYVHPGAYIGRDVTIGNSVVIEAGAFISDGASIGDQAYIGVGVYVGSGARIGIGVKLLSAEPEQLPVIIEDGAVLEVGVVIQAGSHVISKKIRVSAGVTVGPNTIFYIGPNGNQATALPPDSTICNPSNHTLIIEE